MKEVVLFGAYTNTPEKEITLIENILKWKKYNIPIALSTHHSVNERIQNLVDYYIFDKEQHLESKLMNYHIYESDEFKITAAFDKPYHAAAGLIALQNALRMIGDKFDFVYLQDYDVQLNVSEVLKIVRPLQTSEFEMFMFNWHNNPKLYTTNCWFFKQGSYNKLWGDIQSVQDYLDLVALTEEHDHLIEPLAKNLINKKQLQEVLYLFNQDQIKKMILN